ncbi:hypothetical protein [Streptomyces sp. MB09-02B]|uniref:hypothetical protein n=1 Tax=Streptomyces sp. MB09-02B TaxID=3028667 RepID=UPI0029BF9685|nr:hypothetical protein [Streptomyces sp. MB09-02B]MDX3643235.1 hypothetical protein [Streptomyces sp. MB09-02B]
MFDPTELAASEATLTFKRYALQQVVNSDLAFDVDASVQQGVWGDMVYRLTARVLADDLPPEGFTARQHLTYEVPASTWQMWKKRHARRWYARRLVARWPVRYEPDPDGRGTDAVCTFNLERWRSYPQARVHLPRDRFGDPVRVHAIRDLRWTEETP